MINATIGTLVSCYGEKSSTLCLCFSVTNASENLVIGWEQPIKLSCTVVGISDRGSEQLLCVKNVLGGSADLITVAIGNNSAIHFYFHFDSAAAVSFVSSTNNSKELVLVEQIPVKVAVGKVQLASNKETRADFTLPHVGNVFTLDCELEQNDVVDNCLVMYSIYCNGTLLVNFVRANKFTYTFNTLYNDSGFRSGLNLNNNMVLTLVAQPQAALIVKRLLVLSVELLSPQHDNEISQIQSGYKLINPEQSSVCLMCASQIIGHNSAFLKKTVSVPPSTSALHVNVTNADESPCVFTITRGDIHVATFTIVGNGSREVFAQGSWVEMYPNALIIQAVSPVSFPRQISVIASVPATVMPSKDCLC